MCGLQGKTTNMKENKMPGDPTISKQNLPEVPFSRELSFIVNPLFNICNHRQTVSGLLDYL